MTERISLVNQPVWLAGLGASLAINSYRTLKFLYLSIIVEGDDCDLLCGLCRELRFIVRNNILEEVILNVVVEDDSSESEDWSAFDSVLTESGAFPMLHRVSVEISMGFKFKLGELNLVMESLKDKFLRLVESKAVEFNLVPKRR